ncbi:MAG: hypothetical protein IH822_01010 [Chloroflexi bacterium]|nr:hypothetical protein [Chloroflexota bacterium]
MACNGDGEPEQTIVISFTTPTVVPTATSTPTPDPTRTPTPTPTPNPDVCGVNPDPAPASLLQVQEPQPGENVRASFHLRGWGSTESFQQIGVGVAVINAGGDVVKVLDPVPAQPRAFRALPSGLENTDLSSPFAVDIQIPGLAGPTSFCLWVFLDTDPEGLPKGVLQVPVLVTP